VALEALANIMGSDKVFTVGGILSLYIRKARVLELILGNSITYVPN
jgi:hypothetical protein